MHTVQNSENYSYETLEWDKIYSFLDGKIASEPGREYLDSRRPLIFKKEIEKSLKTNIEAQYLRLSGSYLPFSGFKETKVLTERLSLPGAVMTPLEINVIITGLEIASEILGFCKNRQEDYPLLWKIAKEIQCHPKITKSIRKKIDETGEILDSASSELKKIRQEIYRVQDKMKAKILSLVKVHTDKGHLQESLYTIKNGRYVLPVKDGNQKTVGGIIHQVSSTGGTYFVEPIEITELNSRVGRLFSREEDEIRKILKEISIILSEIVPDLEINRDVVAILDYHNACGALGAVLGSVAPDVSESNELSLFRAKHPLLLLKADNQNDVIPLDLELGTDFRTLVISGPNAGGKTVAIKCIGLLSLMVQFGLPIPVNEGSIIPIFKRIIAEIGDPQSLEDDLSTYSAKLTHIKNVVDGLTDRDLILVDEIGSGTDPDEGVGLAAAVCDYLTDNNVLTVVTTHQGGMKVYANQTEFVENASLAFDEEHFKPTYKLSVGVPGSSYAIELAKRIGLNKEIIDSAKDRIGGKKLKIEHFIRDLEGKITKLDSELADAESKTQELSDKIKLYEDKKKNIESGLKEKLELEIHRNEEQLREVNKKFETLVRELKEKSASKEVIKEAKEFINTEKDKLEARRTKIKSRPSPDPRQAEQKKVELKKGDHVRVVGQSQVGVIVSHRTTGKRLSVQFDSMRMDIEKSKLEFVLAQKTKTKKKSFNTIPFEHVRDKLDLRGMMGETAVDTVDKYISDAIASNLSTVQIVHGKGTGVLRHLVTEFLKEDKRIADFRIGEYGEGDHGVTIVKLK